MIRYQGYTGVFGYDEESESFTGHIIDTRGTVNIEGKSVEALTESMRCAVDDHLEEDVSPSRNSCFP